MATNQPTKQELIEAVREFLEREIQPALTDDSLAFKLRIALNVIKIVERELQLAPQFEQQSKAALQLLLSCGEGSEDELQAQLCKRIQGGEFDANDSALLALLGETAMHKLAIDNPGYSTYKRLLAGSSSDDA